MISIRQYQILNSCSDDYEQFYFLFAEVNFGGQLFYRTAGDNYLRHVEDQDWPIKVSAEYIIKDAVLLINNNLLDCFHFKDEQRIPLAHVTVNDLSIYNGYKFKTLNEHLNHYNYGPHEFLISASGLNEMEKPEYREYDHLLGWDQ